MDVWDVRNNFVQNASFREDAAAFLVVIKEIVVAEADADWGNGAEVLEPSFEASAFGGGIQGILVVDEIASDNDEARLVFFGATKNSLEAVRNAFIKMDVADGKNLLFSLFWLVKAVVARIKRFHQVNYTSYGIFFEIFET